MKLSCPVHVFRLANESALSERGRPAILRNSYLQDGYAGCLIGLSSHTGEPLEHSKIAVLNSELQAYLFTTTACDLEKTITPRQADITRQKTRIRDRHSLVEIVTTSPVTASVRNRSD